MSKKGVALLQYISQKEGLIWDKMSALADLLKSDKGTILHHTKEMEEDMPLKHHIKNNLYTRELFMPKDRLVLSFIHKQDHPSFLLKGRVSYITNEGEIKTISAPYIIQTPIGTQRVLYTHSDCIWTCVFNVKSETVEEAEKEVFTENYRELPIEVINEKLELCQEY